MTPTERALILALADYMVGYTSRPVGAYPMRPGAELIRRLAREVRNEEEMVPQSKVKF